MRYHVITLNNGEELKFRLTADEIETLERVQKTKILDFIQDYSVTKMIILLEKMWKQEGCKTTHDDAVELFDTLADNGYAVESIAKEIIWPTCVVSGLLTESDLKKALKKPEQATQ